MNTVNLVATVPTIKRLLPEQFAKRYAQHLVDSPEWTPNGPISADFPLDPSNCKTEFGRWLAETINTTRFDDDFSRLTVTLGVSEEDLHVREALERFGACRIRNARDFERFQTQVRTWLESREKNVRMIGDFCFHPRAWTFQWPVFGSASAREAATPEEFFDMCAGHIRALKPAKVLHYATKAEPPSALQVVSAFGA
ncbi:MAG: hypothetical protein IH627_13075 [Rubrivivax sp.]|nr:hypothetical protein [Rubrivivax sp.]